MKYLERSNESMKRRLKGRFAGALATAILASSAWTAVPTEPVPGEARIGYHVTAHFTDSEFKRGLGDGFGMAIGIALGLAWGGPIGGIVGGVVGSY